uniref:Uncharacterized protein n=1 Tax=Myotis myotis TaxID=51298 RepID=A0A7J8AMS7_MYOMY|nr:hypothetical protein mMyoMyo1_008018 [Myotis myotis]
MSCGLQQSHCPWPCRLSLHKQDAGLGWASNMEPKLWAVAFILGLLKTRWTSSTDRDETSENRCLGLLGLQMGPECWATVTGCLRQCLACGRLLCESTSLQRRMSASLTQTLGWSGISSQRLSHFQSAH